MMNPAVEEVLAHLRTDFPDANVHFVPDGGGGGRVIIESVDLGQGYSPAKTWLGAHLPSTLPYADIYPLFIGAEVVKANSQPHNNPICAGHSFDGRPAIQISKRTNNLVATAEAAALKFTKVLHFIREAAK